jgi:hypothetical protein
MHWKSSAINSARFFFVFRHSTQKEYYHHGQVSYSIRLTAMSLHPDSTAIRRIPTDAPNWLHSLTHRGRLTSSRPGMAP